MGNLTPTPKVAAGGTTGAAVLVLLWIAGLLGLELPPEVAGAIVLLATAGAAWLKSDLSSPGRHAAE